MLFKIVFVLITKNRAPLFHLAIVRHVSCCTIAKTLGVVGCRWNFSAWSESSRLMSSRSPSLGRATPPVCPVPTICWILTRKPSYRWQTRATLKHAENCSNSTCLLRCRWQYWPIFIRLAVVASEICEISRNSLKIQTYGVQGYPRSSILVSMESPCVTSY